jgi:hypothetical protein
MPTGADAVSGYINQLQQMSQQLMIQSFETTLKTSPQNNTKQIANKL